MRENKSPSGSVIDMRSSLPARLDEAGDHALGPEVAERDAAHLQLAVIGARAPGDFAPIADAHLGGVARQFGELQRRREALLHRRVLVARDRAQLRTASRILLGKPRPPLVLLD